MAERKTKRRAQGVYERDGRFVVPIWQGGRREWNMLPRGASLDDAKRFKLDREEAKRTGRSSRSETVASFAGRWLEDFPRSDSTRLHHTERISRFVRDFGDRLLTDVQRQEARVWAVANRGRVPSVRAMFGDAVRDGLCDRNPFEGLRLEVSQGRRQLDVLTEAELVELADTAVAVHGEYGQTLRAMILTAGWTAMRAGELFAMRWGWVDWDRGEVLVRSQVNSKLRSETPPKNGRQRRVVLTPPAREALESLVVGDAQGLVFATKTGVRFYDRLLAYVWNPVRAEFARGLPEHHWLRERIRVDPQDRLDFHELRHFAATWLLDRGLPAHVVAVQLGHEDNGRQVMRTYGHPSHDTARDAIRGVFDR